MQNVVSCILTSTHYLKNILLSDVPDVARTYACIVKHSGLLQR